MRLLNKKGYVNQAPLFIASVISFIITVYFNWLFNPNKNEINFWNFLIEKLIKVTVFIIVIAIGFTLIIAIIAFIWEYVHSNKDWLKFYENKVSKITIKSLIDEIDNYNSIKEKALEIFNKNSDSYLFSYMIIFDESDKIDDEELYKKEILEKFEREIPLLINKVKETACISFEENNYSVLKKLSFQLNFININKDSSIFYEFDENVKEVINSRIMNKILENNSKEYIVAYIILYLFFGDVVF